MEILIELNLYFLIDNTHQMCTVGQFLWSNVTQKLLIHGKYVDKSPPGKKSCLVYKL